jgi:Na+/melibiose symporter-like transporter
VNDSCQLVIELPVQRAKVDGMPAVSSQVGNVLAIVVVGLVLDQIPDDAQVQGWRIAVPST